METAVAENVIDFKKKSTQSSTAIASGYSTVSYDPQFVRSGRVVIDLFVRGFMEEIMVVDNWWNEALVDDPNLPIEKYTNNMSILCEADENFEFVEAVDLFKPTGHTAADMLDAILNGKFKMLDADRLTIASIINQDAREFSKIFDEDALSAIMEMLRHREFMFNAFRDKSSKSVRIDWLF